MDQLKDLIKINITDKDGITVDSTNYKLANGAKIILITKGYPHLSFDNYLNSQENLHTSRTLTSTLSKELGPTKFSGNKRPTITMDVLIPVMINTPTRAQYATMTGTTYLTHYLLYNMWRYPHRMYLNDLINNATIPRIDYPINILINNKDLLNQTTFNSDGVPVILQSFSQTGEQIVQHQDTLKEETFFEYKLTFLVDNYGD